MYECKHQIHIIKIYSNFEGQKISGTNFLCLNNKHLMLFDLHICLRK